MQTKHMFVIWSCFRIKGKVLHGKIWFKPPIVFLLTNPRQFVFCSSSLFVHLCIICGMCFVLICSLILPSFVQGAL